MSLKRPFLHTNSHGAGSGASFDGRAIIQDTEEATLSRIVVAHSQYIISITAYYKGQTQNIRHGGDTDGTVTEVNLDPDEFITTIEGSLSSDKSVVAQLSFVSNKEKKWGPYGTMGGHAKFTWDARTMGSAELAPYMGLLYFSGTSGWVITSLQATFAKYPGPAMKPPSVVRYEQQTSEEDSPQSLAAFSKFALSIMSPVVILTVGVDEIEFHAYEDLLCQLSFFRAALRSGFKETTDKKISMPEDEPLVIAALIEFLYIGNYTYTYGRDLGSVEKNKAPPPDVKEGSFHLRVYATAFKYDCQGLAQAAMGSLVYVLQRLDGMAVVQLLKESYDRGCGTALWGMGEEMSTLKKRLPEILKGVYFTHDKDMADIIFECPALANDLLRLSVSGH